MTLCNKQTKKDEKQRPTHTPSSGDCEFFKTGNNWNSLLLACTKSISELGSNALERAMLFVSRWPKSYSFHLWAQSSIAHIAPCVLL